MGTVIQLKQSQIEFKDESARIRAGRELADIIDGFARSGRVSLKQAREFRRVMTAAQVKKDQDEALYGSH